MLNTHVWSGVRCGPKYERPLSSNEASFPPPRLARSPFINSHLPRVREPWHHPSHLAFQLRPRCRPGLCACSGAPSCGRRLLASLGGYGRLPPCPPVCMRLAGCCVSGWSGSLPKVKRCARRARRRPTEATAAAQAHIEPRQLQRNTRPARGLCAPGKGHAPAIPTHPARSRTHFENPDPVTFVHLTVTRPDARSPHRVPLARPHPPPGGPPETVRGSVGPGL